MLHHALSVSYEGKRVTYLGDKYSDTTKGFFVLVYCPIQRESYVAPSTPEATPMFTDVPKLVKEHPSCVVEPVSSLSEDEQVLYCAAMSKIECKLRPAKRKADMSIQASAPEQASDWPASEEEMEAPRPRVRPRRSAPAAANHCSVCMDSERDMLAVACSHLAVCQDCAARLTACPICTTNTGFRRVFFP
eukprot:1720953-Prymnesium_polylepis.3